MQHRVQAGAVEAVGAAAAVAVVVVVRIVQRLVQMLHLAAAVVPVAPWRGQVVRHGRLGRRIAVAPPVVQLARA